MRYFFEDSSYSDPNILRGKQLFASSGVLGLRASVGVRSDSVRNFFAGISITDLIFTSVDPSQVSTSVTARMAFSGEVSGSPGIAYSPSGTLSFNGVVDCRFLTQPDSSINDILEVTTEVPLNTTVRLAANLGMTIATNLGEFGFLAFADSLDFIPNEVFLLEDGITVDSASWGLVSNQLSVPLPGLLSLLTVGTIALLSRRKTRAVD